MASFSPKPGFYLGEHGNIVECKHPFHARQAIGVSDNDPEMGRVVCLICLASAPIDNAPSGTEGGA